MGTLFVCRRGRLLIWGRTTGRTIHHPPPGGFCSVLINKGATKTWGAEIIRDTGVRVFVHICVFECDSYLNDILQ